MSSSKDGKTTGLSTMEPSSGMEESAADDELFDPPRRITNSDIYRIFKLGEIIHMPHSDTDWEMGLIQQERD